MIPHEFYCLPPLMRYRLHYCNHASFIGPYCAHVCMHLVYVCVERLTIDIPSDPRLGSMTTDTDNTCPQNLPTAASCKEIYDCNPNSPSGYYWRDSSPPELMYCAMNLTRCGNTTGGWTRVAHIDMTRPEATCPSPLETIVSPRSCSPTREAGCSSVSFPTFGVPYTEVYSIHNVTLY